MTGEGGEQDGWWTASTRPLAEAYDALFLDLDGVVYRGRDPVPGAVAGLEAARDAGARVVFVTNNASRTPGEVAEHLSGLGVPAEPDEVVTSAQAAAACLAARVPAGAPVLVVGGGGLVDAVRACGLHPVTHEEDGPAAVVSGFHPDLGWRLLAEGTFAVRRGVPWVATNTDRTLPTPRGLAPGNGTMVDVIRVTAGREPEVAGKPYAPLHEEAVRRSGARRPLVVGDRLDTDVEGAVRNGADSLLVLTGVSGVAELLAAPPTRRPRYVGRDLRALLEPHPAPQHRHGAWGCGGWWADVADGRLRLRGGGDRLDAVRAATAAAWTSERPVDGEDVLHVLDAGTDDGDESST